MKKLEKYITDGRTGLKYELVNDYYFIAGDDEPEEHPIGIWGQRRLRYLKQHHKVLYYNLLISSELHSHLADTEDKAQSLFLRSVKELAEKEGITEQLKATNQLKWVQKMNNIRERVTEVVNAEVVFV
mgnify:CR=1 FL=1